MMKGKLMGGLVVAENRIIKRDLKINKRKRHPQGIKHSNASNIPQSQNTFFNLLESLG